MIPMDNFEGRYSAAAHAAMVHSAADSKMNMLRIWGGGIFLPESFYAGAQNAACLGDHVLHRRARVVGILRHPHISGHCNLLYVHLPPPGCCPSRAALTLRSIMPATRSNLQSLAM